MKVLSFIICLLMGADALGQTFIAEGEISTVADPGFYRILLPVDASLYFNELFTNIRLFDENDKEVPYLFQSEAPRTTEVFSEYKIVARKHVNGCCTSIVLHNPDQSLLNNIHLVVRNAEITKQAVLLGSDDSVTWFALKENFLLSPAANANNTSEIKIVGFPLSNYEYYTLRIDDSTSAPLNILKAGYFKVQNESGKYDEVPSRDVQKIDTLKDKKTYVRVRYNGARTVDKFELVMKGAPFFQRQTSVYVTRKRELRKGKVESYYERIRETVITSKRPLSIELPGYKVNELLIVIDNDDNPQLDIDSFHSYQLNRYLTAWLEANKKYMIKAGRQDLTSPVYDISFFKDSIPDNPQVLQVSEMTLISTGQLQPTAIFFTTRAFIWIAVIAVVVFLGFMSVRLLNEASSTDKK